MTISVTLTQAARERLMASCTFNSENTVFLSVINKGCGGNSYSVGFIDRAEVQDGDTLVDLESGRVLAIDGKSAPFLDGTEIHYEETQWTGGFVFRNPKAVASCGCGNSFSTSTDQIQSCS